MLVPLFLATHTSHHSVGPPLAAGSKTSTAVGLLRLQAFHSLVPQDGGSAEEPALLSLRIQLPEQR